MENFSVDGGLTLDDIKKLYATNEPEPVQDIDDYADGLRMQIDVRKAELRRIRSKRSTFFGRSVGLIRWAAKPKKNKPQVIPGPGLEFALFGIHLVLLAGHFMLSLG